MTFDHPERLWLALGVVVLWWLSAPPPPRQHLWTPHLAVWRAALADVRMAPPRRSWWRLLCLALAWLAVVTASAGPSLPGKNGAARLVVLLDGSASMARAHGQDSAFHAALAMARRELAGVPADVEVTVVRCGGPVLRRTGTAARAMLDLGEPGGAAVGELAAVAAAVAADGTAVWTLTDGQGRDLPAVGALSRFGAPVANAALRRVQFTDRWPLPACEASCEVVAHAPGPLTAELHWAGPIRPVAPVTLRLQPGVPTTVPCSLVRTGAGGVLQATLVAVGDGLATDDRWQIELPPLPAPRLAVLAEPGAGPYAAVAATALAAEVAGEVVPATPGAPVGFLLVDGGVAALAPGPLRAVCFGALPPGGQPELPWQEPVVTGWDRQHPLLAGLDLAELRLARADRAALPAGEPFLWGAVPGGPEQPLGVLCRHGESASVHFAFRLADGNLPLLPAFPQLLRRAFVLAHGRSAQAGPATTPPPPTELDLGAAELAADRPLPPFRTPPQPLAPVCLLVALLALALRAFCR